MADINEELLRALNGPAPQHKKYGEQAFEFTEGEQGKLFTGNHVMTDSGLWVPQKGTSDGAINTQLTGSNVEVLTDLQTTNTGSSIGETQGGSTIALNYSMYKSIVIYIENNHEELISFSAIDFYQKESADISEEERIFRADGFPTTIEAGATAIYTVDDIPELAYPFGSMVLRFFAYPPPNEEEYSIVKVFGGA